MQTELSKIICYTYMAYMKQIMQTSQEHLSTSAQISGENELKMDTILFYSAAVD